LKNDLQRPSGPGSANQLKTVRELPVPPHDKVGEETLHSLFERNGMGSEFIAVKVVLKVMRLEVAPVYQSRYPYSWIFSPNAPLQPRRRATRGAGGCKLRFA
jgi:hypothetical protein